MATINPAEYFRLYDRGAIAPGYLANLITITDLPGLKVDKVFYRGKLVAEGDEAVFSLPHIAPELTDTVHIKPLSADSLRLTTAAEAHPVIEIVPGQIVTKKRMERVKVVNGEVMPDLRRDILKLVVVERHKASGNVGIGLVKGFGLKEGALASSIAHDSHNIVVVGTDDFDILKAVDEIQKLQGGLVVSSKGEIMASLPLPVAGLLSPEPLDVVVSHLEEVEKAATKLGNLPPAPFSILSFLALPVIPELRLTDLGLVDVTEFKLLK
jgi:adenine deaminase